jgi:hypothetical protein
VTGIGLPEPDPYRIYGLSGFGGVCGGDGVPGVPPRKWERPGALAAARRSAAAAGPPHGPHLLPRQHAHHLGSPTWLRTPAATGERR